MTAGRHAQDVVDGNLQRLMGGFAGSAFRELMASGASPPTADDAAAHPLGEPDGDPVPLHVRSANDADALASQLEHSR